MAKDYELINANIAGILDSISQSGHVDEYDYLMENRGLVSDSEYRRRYRSYWQLNLAFPSPEFIDTYFRLLQEQFKNPKELREIVEALYKIPATSRGEYKVHFSFATKLFHMADPHSPIYDKMVAGFYAFGPPDLNKIARLRIDKYVTFHKYLKSEYESVVEYGLLSPSIRMFRKQFNPKHFTDEKVIDSLIWAYGGKK